MEICFLDMDGVLADFSQQVKNKLGYDSEIVKGREKDSLSPEELKIKQGISDLVHHSNDFWITMPKTEYADELLKTCKDNFDKTFILSNYNPPDGFRHRFYAVKSLKKNWLEEKLDIKDVGVIISDKQKSAFVPHNHTGFLIDDMNSNILDWNRYGGIGIVHKEYEITKNKLQHFLKISKNAKILTIINTLQLKQNRFYS